MRCFEKISYKQFENDIKLNQETYNNYDLPKRSTKYSAGYDFRSLIRVELNPGEIMKIPTGIKCDMENDEVLMIFIRSSMGFKYNIRLVNQVGIIDKDYYNNPDNEGHIWIKLQNEGNEFFCIEQNDTFAQGVFTKFLTVANDNVSSDIRTGGFGSTNKEEL